MPKGVYDRVAGHTRALKAGWVKRKADPLYSVKIKKAIDKRSTHPTWNQNVVAANKKRIYVKVKDNSIDDNYQGA